MYDFILKAVALTSAALFLTGIAQAADDPIEVLLNQVNLDLSNPDASAKRVIDKEFKSNDPAMRSRVYLLNDGTRVKLVGYNFSKTSDVDRLKITYPRDAVGYKKSRDALVANFGKPPSNRENVLVWRLENDPKTSTQSKTLKLILGINNNNKYTIYANRQAGGKGNNPRVKQITRTNIPSKKKPTPKKIPVKPAISDF